MGFAASQARLMMLVARKSDLELEGQFINQARVTLANMSAQLFQNSANLDPNSQQVKILQSRIAALQAIDKSLELSLRRIDTQREAISTEMDAVRKVIAKNIQETFKIFG